ncbi:hypothetical protein [Neobacillus drentensis]|uniref:hypothetical protein n=1 Tax=Neobacillus drentensis TaxID=220684 RepID=UPI00285BAE9A|nr:hypothetical protein [Neobacillus drentensis]MDR7236531.1 hypothetical protein [Neobacillus drentensis]
MEETLNIILSELQNLDKGQQDIIVIQKDLLSRTENLEKGQKKLLSSTKNINKGHDVLISGQQQLKIRLENLEKNKDLLFLGQNELKELVKQTTAYMAGRLSISERIILEIELLNEKDRQEVLHNINEKIFLRKNNTCWDNGEDDMYNDF